jgi:hypothetical protein
MRSAGRRRGRSRRYSYIIYIQAGWDKPDDDDSLASSHFTPPAVAFVVSRKLETLRVSSLRKAAAAGRSGGGDTA